ncbi:hypothetical protein D3C76_1436560 [compost metagenome]
MRTPLTGFLVPQPRTKGRAHQQVLEHGHFHERVRDLVGTANALLAALEHRFSGDVAALEMNRAFVRRHATGDQVEQRAFTRAVGADDAQCFSGLQGQVDGIRDLHLAVAFVHIAHL